ncbi:hypothetical protein [Peribacillus butanolivorans]|uniref:hypothetical protein n=1 Tax=Peribacillus butanolivorans TaxID=421767 RepID=UPI00365328D5
MKTIFSLMFTVTVTFLAMFSFSNVSFAAGESQYDLIDGKQVSTNANDPKVKHIYYTGDEQGNEVRLGFTTQQKVDDYIKNENKVEKESIVSSNFETLGTGIGGSGTCCTDFYTDANKWGAYIKVRVGDSFPNITSSLGRTWNDVISSISTANTGSTYLYQHEYKRGGYIRFNNAYYWGKTINLSNYKFSNGVSANNNASSVYVLK